MEIPQAPSGAGVFDFGYPPGLSPQGGMWVQGLPMTLELTWR